MDSIASSSHNVHKDRRFTISSSQEDIFQKKYKGVRRRKWGKWVSEIRVPGTQERLWLGSYTTPEAAAVAHDVAFYCLRGLLSPDNFNFPLTLPSSVRDDMSPKSVQRAASDAGMAVDAQMITDKSYDRGHCNREVLPMSTSSMALESSLGLSPVEAEFTRNNNNNNSDVLMRRSWQVVNDKMLQETELWEDCGGYHDHLICCGKWPEMINEAREGDQSLSISVYDYL